MIMKPPVVEGWCVWEVVAYSHYPGDGSVRTRDFLGTCGHEEERPDSPLNASHCPGCGKPILILE